MNHSIKQISVIRIITAAFAVAQIAGCSSTDNKSKAASDQLDIALTNKPAEGIPSFAKNSSVSLADKGELITVLSESDRDAWKDFFKPAPSADERSMLEKKVATWKNSSSPDELVKRGQNQSALGLYAAAEASFRECLRLKPDNIDAALELAILYLRRKNLPGTFEMLSQVKDGIYSQQKASGALAFRYRYVLALALIERGDREKGHRVLSDLIGLNKEFAPGYAALASSYLNMGKDSVAEFIAKRGLDRGKDDAALMSILGVIAEKRNEPLQARSWYNKALEISPTYAAALVNRANLAILESEYGPAEEDLQKAISVAPNSVEAFVALGIVQRKTGRYTAARDNFNKALEVDPDSAIARYNLGVLSMADLNQPAEAMRLFTEVLQIKGGRDDLRESAKTLLTELRTGISQSDGSKD